MRFQHGSAMSFCMVKVPEIAKYAFSALIRSVVLRMMVAEMAEYAFSAQIRNVLLHSDLADMVEYSFSARMAE